MLASHFVQAQSSALPVWSQIGASWQAEMISQDHVLISNKNKHSFIFISRFDSKADAAGIEKYFANDFKKQSLEFRRQLMPELWYPGAKADIQITQRDGLQFGQITNQFNFNQSFARLSERMFFVKGSFWHLAIIESRAIVPTNLEQDEILQRIQEGILKQPKAHASLIQIFLGSAYAQNEAFVPNSANPGSRGAGGGIIPACLKTGIDPQKLNPGERSFMRFSLPQLGRACVENLKHILPEMKAMLKFTYEETRASNAKYIDEFSCDPKDMGSLGAEACYEGAANGAIADSYTVVGKLAATATSKLWHWVESQDDFGSAVKSIAQMLGTKVDGYTCLKPEPQAEVVCKTLAEVSSFAASIGCAVITKGTCAGMVARQFLGLLGESGEEIIASWKIGKKAVSEVSESERLAILSKKALASFSLDRNLPKAAQVKILTAGQQIRNLGFIPDAYNDSRISRAIKFIQDPTMAQGFKHALSRSKDASAFADYIQKLTQDAFQDMMKSKRPNVVLRAQAGEIKQRDLLRIIVKRARERNDPNFQKIKFIYADTFFEAVQKGPVIDKALKDSDHGMLMHALQRDYYAPVLDMQVKGGSQAVNNYLASKQGQEMWNSLMDGNGMYNAQCPEYIKGTILRSASIPLE